jgi:helix-turn-helix protein
MMEASDRKKMERGFLRLVNDPDHPAAVQVPEAFAKLAVLDEAEGTGEACASYIISWPSPGRSSWLRFTPNRERKREVNVKQLRLEAGMSQAEFAHAFCVNPRTLQEWEQRRAHTRSSPGNAHWRPKSG